MESDALVNPMDSREAALDSREAALQPDVEAPKEEGPARSVGCSIVLWFLLGLLLGAVVTQLPLPASKFTKALRKESRFFQREAKLLENSFSKAAANESKLLVQVTRNATDSVHAVEEQVEKRIQGLGPKTHTHTLTTTTQTTTKAPPIFVTIQTEGMSLLEKVGGPFEVFNIGRGKPWHGFKTKFELLLPFLKSRNQSELVAFMDGTDIFWGGCEMSEFLHYYEKIVEYSGAEIVISAEIACREQPCEQVPKVPDWAERMEGKDLNDGWWKKFVSTKGCGGDGCFCAKPPAVKFLNSGFLMGPVSALIPMISWSLWNYERFTTLGDQSVLAKYWFIHPDKIALDYSGALCLSTSDLNPYVLFSKDPTTGGLWNKAFGRMQCLAHGNGRGRYMLWDLLGRFSVGKHGRRYAQALNYKKKL